MKKKYTLIFTVDYLPLKIGSGIANYTYNLADNLSKLGENILVVAPKTIKSNQFDAAQNFKTLRVPTTIFLREIFACFLIGYFILNKKVGKILNFNWFPCGLISLIMFYFFKIPYYVFVYGADIIENIKKHPSKKHILRSKLYFLKNLIFKNSQKIFACSSYTKKLLLNFKKQSKIKVINPGISLEKFTNLNHLNLKNKYNFTSKNIILTVCRLDFYKGVDTVINILPDLKKIFKDVVYIIVGEGPEKNNLIQLANKLQVNNSVFFVGAVSNKDLKYFYKICNLFIMVSKELKEMGEVEGFGIVYLEAQSLGKPVIASKNSGATNAIKNNITGFLVNPENSKEIKNKIVKLLEDKTLAKKLGDNGKEFVKNFKWEKIAEKLFKELN